MKSQYLAGRSANYWLLLFLISAPVLISCHSNSEMGVDQQANTESQSSPAKRSDDWLQLQNAYSKERNQGMDFYAMGINPDWTLSIDADSLIRFESSDLTEDFNATGSEGRQPADFKGTMYFIKNDESICNIQIVPDSCLNSKGELLPYSLKIRLENQDGIVNHFVGCGMYLNDPSLNDIWALKSWSSLSVPKQISGNPTIQLNLGTNRMYGNLGCGDIQGFITPKGNKLKIYGLELVDQNTPCQSAFTNELFEKLNFKDFSIQREGLNLVLSTPGDSLVFRKVD